MFKQYGKVHLTQTPLVQLSAEDLQLKRSTNNKKKEILSPLKNSIKTKPLHIPVHFTWALVLTILCFFLIGPCWALYKTFQLRRMIEKKEFEDANSLSNKISVVLVISTIIGIFIWVSILFCSVGLLLTGILLSKHFI